MDELFRFALSRPAEQTSARTCLLERGSKLQQQLRGIVDAHRDRSQWGRMRALASEYLAADATAARVRAAITTPKGGDAQTIAIRADIEEVRAFGRLLLDAIAADPEPPWPQTALDLAGGLFQSNGIDELSGSLADLFIALLLFRSAGPQLVPELLRKDSFDLLAIYREDRPSLRDVGDLIRLIDVAMTLKVDAPSLATSAAFITALRRTLELPPKIFGRRASTVHAVGITDLLVVKQHIHHYELGEIARVENILKGETRTHDQRHTLSTERESIFETDKQTETDEELTSSDHVSIRNEVEAILKEDTSVNAGVHAQYDGGSYKIQADVTVAYDRSSSISKKSANEIAKDVTQRAAKRVSERARQSSRTKVVETFDEKESQSFANLTGPHVSGIYQWLQKVYLAQVFNYGKHLMFDIMVPEPGASLISAATAALEEVQLPVAPPPLTISPLDLTDDINDTAKFYGTWIAKYGVTGVEPPPPASISLPAVKTVEYADDTQKRGEDVLRLEDGYAAEFARVTASWVANDKSNTPGQPAHDPADSYVDLTVQGKTTMLKWADGTKEEGRNLHITRSISIDPAERAIAYSFRTNEVNGLTLNIEFVCKRTDTLFAQWKLQTYDKIATRFQKLQEDFEAKNAALKFQKRQEGILGAADPEMNRQIERVELKRSAIAILANDKELIDGQNEVVATSAAAPKPKFFDPAESSQETGAIVRFLEQAFEWDKISYVLYPYFWGRASEWVGKLQRKHDDPLFESFLRAGYARVVIPVRNGFEDAVNFFLVTGSPWLGGELPSVGDRTYLPITEELKEQTGAPGDEVPVGAPWFVHVATRTIKLRTGNESSELPRWVRDPAIADPPGGPWAWKEDTSSS